MKNNYKITGEISKRENVVPGLEKDGKLEIYCLLANLSLKDRLEYITSKRVRLIEVDKEVLDRMREEVYKKEKEEIGVKDLDLLDSILLRAKEKEASDIHIDPKEKGACIRMRIMGALINFQDLEEETYLRLVSRIKILSNLDIAQKRLPQDGGFNKKIQDEKFDIRVAVIPTIHGEKLVLRLLDSENISYTMQGIGICEKDKEKIENLIKQPSGLILISGPTGSGKSSTSYTLLNLLNKSSRNIMTIEDPVEYKIGGINQIQVNEKLGLDFSKGLHSILRLDPDIIMVGEIRDEESAKVALRSSITGHLVISTLHAHDGIASIIRLLNMGQAAYMVAGGLIGIISQRLYRKLCPHCKREVQKYSKLLGRVAKLYEAGSCEFCQDGYYERAAVFEILTISDGLRQLIKDDISEEDLREQAKREGLIGLKEKFKNLVEEGITSEDEVFRNIFTLEDL